jgi:hypothetical protein
MVHGPWSTSTGEEVQHLQQISRATLPLAARRSPSVLFGWRIGDKAYPFPDFCHAGLRSGVAFQALRDPKVEKMPRPPALPAASVLSRSLTPSAIWARDRVRERNNMLCRYIFFKLSFADFACHYPVTRDPHAM